MNTEDRMEELMDQYACDDAAIVNMAEEIIQLETYLEAREQYISFLAKEYGEAITRVAELEGEVVAFARSQLTHHISDDLSDADEQYR